MSESRFARRFPGFTLRATRTFTVFVLAVPVLGLAALNTGNNSLYLLLAMTLGAFVASGVLSRHTLAVLRARAWVEGEPFAGSPAAVHVQVFNRSRWLPVGGVVCRLIGLPGQVLVPRVAPTGTVETLLMTAFPRRGRVTLPRLQLEVRLPLGFFLKSLRLRQEGEALVYPRRFAGAAARFSGLVDAEVDEGRGRRRRGGEVDQLRDFNPGDDTRDIHWKQTARQQRLIVVERRQRARPSRYLILDRQLPRLNDTQLSERFEDLVSEVATAALNRLRRGEPVGLVLGSSVTPPGLGRRHTRAILEQLALVIPVGPGEDRLPVGLGKGPIYRLVGGP